MDTRRQRRVVIALLAAAWCAGQSAGAQVLATGAEAVAAVPHDAALERARLHYQAGEYQPCAEVLGQVVLELGAGSAAEIQLKSSARTYLAACLLASGKQDLAREQFRAAIMEDRLIEAPDPVIFPPALLDLFIQERSGLMEELRRQQETELRQAREQARERAERERQRVAELEQLASEEVVVKLRDPWQAWVPFGVGQFVNGDRGLGWFLLGTEVALAGTAIAATSIELGLHSQAQGGRQGLNSAQLNRNIRAARIVGTTSWIGLVVAAVSGGLQAHWAFVPEVEVGRRPRPLPEHLRSRAPTATAPRAHLQIGFFGHDHGGGATLATHF